MGTLNLLKPWEKIRDNPECKPAENNTFSIHPNQGKFCPQGKYSFSLVEIDILIPTGLYMYTLQLKILPKIGTGKE